VVSSYLLFSEKTQILCAFFSVLIFCAGAGIIFLFFAEKILDFFAFFRYHILRSGK